MSTYFTRSQLARLAGLTVGAVRQKDDAGDIVPAFRSARRLGKGRPDEVDRPRFHRRAAFALIVGKTFCEAGLGWIATRKIVRWLDHECLDLEGRFRAGDTHVFACNKHVFFGRADSTFFGEPGALLLLALDVGDLWRRFAAALEEQTPGGEPAPPTGPAGGGPREAVLKALALRHGLAKKEAKSGRAV